MPVEIEEVIDTGSEEVLETGGSEPEVTSSYVPEGVSIPEGMELAIDIPAGMHPDAIATMLADMGEEAFKAKVQEEKTEAPAVEATTEDVVPESAEEIAAFLEAVGMDQTEYLALPEKVQEKLESFYSNNSEKADNGSQAVELEQVRGNLETLLKDPVIASRLELLKSGIVPTIDVPIADAKALAQAIDSAETIEAEEAILRKALADAMRKGGELAFTEAGSKIIERQKQEETIKRGQETVLSLGSIDPRLKTDYTIEQIQAMKQGPDLTAFLASPAGKVVQFLHERGLNWAQVEKLGSKAVYAMYSSENGWDKEALKATIAKGNRSFADRMKNPTTARPVNPSATGGVSGGNLWNGIDVDRMGDHEYIGTLAEKFEGDPKGLSLIRQAEQKYWDKNRRK